MKRINTACLREKDVINLCDGARLGNVSDVEFDACDGRICALLVGRDYGLFGFGKDSTYVIPWCRIECIGEDAVLVRIPEGELCAFSEGKNRPKDKDGLFKM